MRRSIRNNILSILLSVAAVALPAKGWSFGFNPWTTMTGEKTLAINPFIYLPISPAVGLSTDLVAWYGFSPKVDIAINLSSITILSPAAWGGFWVMPRYEFAPNNIVGLSLGYTGSAFLVKPEYDMVIYPEKGILAFEGNLRVPITVGAPTGATLGVEAYLVPVLQFAKSKFAFFVEVNPIVKILPAVSFDLPINPGIWIAFNEAKHQFSLAFTGIALSGGRFGVSPGLGLSYYTTVAFK